MVVGFVVGFGVVGCVVGAVCEGDFGAGATVAGVGGFVAGGWLVVFGVGVVVDFVVVGGGVVDVVKTSPILPIAINTADEIGDVLMGGECFVVVEVAEGVVCVVIVVVVVVEFVEDVGSCGVEGVVGVCCVVLAPHTLFDLIRFPGGVAGATTFNSFIFLSLSL